MAASELESNISTQILTKTKRSYFYFLLIATQTKQILLKRYDFFTHVNINENLKKTDEKKYCLSTYDRATYLDQTQAIVW